MRSADSARTACVNCFTRPTRSRRDRHLPEERGQYGLGRIDRSEGPPWASTPHSIADGATLAEVDEASSTPSCSTLHQSTSSPRRTPEPLSSRPRRRIFYPSLRESERHANHGQQRL